MRKCHNVGKSCKGISRIEKRHRKYFRLYYTKVLMNENNCVNIECRKNIKEAKHLIFLKGGWKGLRERGSEIYDKLQIQDKIRGDRHTGR